MPTYHAWIEPETQLLSPQSPLPLDLPFTVEQAATWGVPRKRLVRLRNAGLVRPVIHGVYAATQAPDDIEFRAQALRLVVPESAVVTDRTAAWLHGVELLSRSRRESTPVQCFETRHGHRLRRPQIDTGERRLLARDRVVVHGVLATSPTRTALDLGRLLWRFDALAALDGFLGVGVSHERLVEECARFKGYRGVVQLRTLLPLADGRAESPAESALRLHWYDAGLPRPEVQLWVCDDQGRELYRLDLALPGLAYAAEYDGLAFHGSDDQRKHDRDRRTWLAGRGWLIDVFGRDDVYGMQPTAPDRLLEGLVEARRRCTGHPS